MGNQEGTVNVKLIELTKEICSVMRKYHGKRLNLIDFRIS